MNYRTSNAAVEADQVNYGYESIVNANVKVLINFFNEGKYKGNTILIKSFLWKS